jgi:hypothetical protein
MLLSTVVLFSQGYAVDRGHSGFSRREIRIPSKDRWIGTYRNRPEVVRPLRFVRFPGDPWGIYLFRSAVDCFTLKIVKEIQLLSAGIEGVFHGGISGLADWRLY